MVFRLPEFYSDELAVEKNRARQLLIPEQEAELSIDGQREFVSKFGAYSVFRQTPDPDDKLLGLFVPSGVRLGEEHDLRSTKGVKWLSPSIRTSPDSVLESLVDAFNFRPDRPEKGQKGLREPQLGAVYAVLGYWATHESTPAIVVMPTGTGKTDTMVALFAVARPQRLLVVVPSDALREQIANKFESLGVLQEFGVVAASALRPIVGKVKGAFKTDLTAASFAQSCNVVVTTPSALYASSKEVRSAFLNEFTHLFVDEAHHVAADTWKTVRDAFLGRTIVQFTATPFREDGKHLGGRLIFAFPLREAQRQQYFSHVNYLSVVSFDDPDRAIAKAAVERLRSDRAEGKDHLIMARVKRVSRAEVIRTLYKEIAPEFVPVIIHSGDLKKTRVAALEAMRSRSSRIIVCVDMLGEGFDLPALKIAAIHDPHKSLGVTLQFVGRFARTGGMNLGDATVVVGRPSLDYDESLRKLYSEDADWNAIIRELSETAVGDEAEKSDFEAAFTSSPETLSIRNLIPRMSTVVYRSEAQDWNPHAIEGYIGSERLYSDPIGLNQKDRVAWFVVENRNPVRWGDVKTIEQIGYDLFIVHFDVDRQLLYINSSNNESLHEGLAKAICGEKSTLVTGEAVYRVMAGINRLVPTNVGVLDVRNHARRFSFHVGADVSEGFPDAEAQTKTKTNIFAYGFEDGNRVSIGASLKGRIWSHLVAESLHDWVEWCHNIGAKVTDPKINIDHVMANFIRPKNLDAFPRLVPLALEWPWTLFQSTTEEVRLECGNESWPLVDVDLELRSFGNKGPLRFAARVPEVEFEFELDIVNGEQKYKPLGAVPEVIVRRERIPLTKFFSETGLTIHLEQEALIVPKAMLIQPDRERPPINLDRLVPIDWKGINLKKESQGPNRDKDSIQAKMISQIQSEGRWDVIIDDDGSGEIADIVAMRLDDRVLHVALIHCKYSKKLTPGARIDDLYAVCGQAQKSARWKRDLRLMFKHLIRREKSRNKHFGRSGMILGTPDNLFELEDRSRRVSCRFEIDIVQPGLSKGGATAPILELLASTETYVREVAMADHRIVCSH